VTARTLYPAGILKKAPFSFFYVYLSFLSRTILDLMITTVDLKKQLQNLANPFKISSFGLFHGTFRHFINKEYGIVSPNDILFLIKDTGHFGS
jgi:hypothetical protein